ncbi:hypothetical protein BGZ54_006609 [Gamsiella multidivaricata]|nr:hypothetical protein BGZ54_006609 [Gamsiella multidivaricata]
MPLCPGARFAHTKSLHASTQSVATQLPSYPYHQTIRQPLVHPHREQFQGPRTPADTPWRPQQTIPGMERPKIDVLELAGKQMLPLEPRSILELTLDSATSIPMTEFPSIVEILRFRGMVDPDATAFSAVDSKGHETGSWTWETIYGRAEKISQAIVKNAHLRLGARVGLVFRKAEVLDFLAAFYGVMIAGMTAVPINMIEEFQEMIYILDHTNMELALTTEYNYMELTKDQNMHKGMDWLEKVVWWKADTLGSNWRPRNRERQALGSLMDQWKPMGLALPDLAYIEFTKAPNGELKGVAVSHRTVLSQCQVLNHALDSSPKRKRKSHAAATTEPSSIPSSTATIGANNAYQQGESTSFPARLTEQSETTSSGTVISDNTTVSECKGTDVVMSWLEPRQQVGLVLGGLLGVYSGSHTVFVRSGITETLGLWETCAHRYQVTMAVGDYEGVREMMHGCKAQDVRPCQLSSLETFLIDTIMVQPLVNRQFTKNFLKPLGVPSPETAVVPIASLPEHGGMILSMRDSLMFPQGVDQIDFGFQYGVPLHMEPGKGGSEPQPRACSTDADAICYYLLDREALKCNIIKVVDTGEEAIKGATKRGVVLVGAFGYTIPRATLAIVDPDTTALCQPSRVGEIWIDSPSIAFGFWNLPQHSQQLFHALPLIIPVDTMTPEIYDPVPAGFLRTGLLGGLIEGRVVVFGLYEDRIQQEVLQGPESAEERKVVYYKYHYTTDLANTVMERIIGFTACVTFETYINDERLPVICAETPRLQRDDLAKLADFVKQAMKGYHGLRPYCIAIAPPGALPRAYKNGRRVIHPVLCQKMLESGWLVLSHLWTSVEDTVFSMAVGDDIMGGIWGLDALTAREVELPAHTRTVQFSSCDRPLEVLDDQFKINLMQFSSLVELLVWRSIVNPEEAAFLEQNQQGKDAKAITFRKFGMKVVSIASYIEKRGGFKPGDKVVLLFPNGVEFAATIYATWLLGLVPVPVSVPEMSRLPEDIVLLMGLLTELRVPHLIGNSVTEEVMKQKTTMIHIKACIGARQDAIVPTVFNVSKAPKVNKVLGKESGYTSPPRTSLVKTAPAVVYAHYSSDMKRTLVKISHASLLAQCCAQKVQCRLTSERTIVSCWKDFVGIGLLQACVLGVYVGAPTLLIQYADFLATPQIYLETIAKYEAKDALLDYAMVERAFAALDRQRSPPTLKLCSVRNFLISMEGRPRTEAQQALERRLCGTSPHDPAGFHIARTHISGMFGHMSNPMVTTRSYMNIEPVRLHLSLKSLRRGVVEVTTEKDDPMGIWVEDSGTPVCGTTVAIVNPETRELCLSGEIGEIWVSSEANVQAYITSPLVIEADSASSSAILSINASQFNAAIAHGVSANSGLSSLGYGLTQDGRMGPGMGFVRTGEIGFLHNYAHENFNGGCATTLLFVLGAIGETFEINGLIHFPIDVETTIEKAHPIIMPSGCIVFQVDQAVVCVIEVRQTDASIINLVFTVMNQVLKKHQFMPDAIAIVKEGVLAKNRYGEKQRGKMLSHFMGAKMPLLYIHYPHGSQPRSIPEQIQPLPAGPNGIVVTYSATSSPTESFASHTTSASLTPSSPQGNCKKKPGSLRSNHSVISVTGSMRSVRSVGSFIGSIFKSSKKDKVGSDQKVPGTGRAVKVSGVKEAQDSIPESGLESLSASPTGSQSMLGPSNGPASKAPATIYT